MKVAIFAEDSTTTSDSSDNITVNDYFQGTFQPVSTLEEELSKYADTELHILSKQYGHLLGDTSIENISEENASESEIKKAFAKAVVTAAEDADVVVVLLSSSTFKDTITRSWSKILSRAQGHSIWCLGASKSALQSIELPDLERKVDSVFVYERVGVAPLGQETRDKFLQKVRENASQAD